MPSTAVVTMIGANPVTRETSVRAPMTAASRRTPRPRAAAVPVLVSSAAAPVMGAGGGSRLSAPSRYPKCPRSPAAPLRTARIVDAQPGWSSALSIVDISSRRRPLARTVRASESTASSSSAAADERPASATRGPAHGRPRSGPRSASPRNDSSTVEASMPERRSSTTTTRTSTPRSIGAPVRSRRSTSPSSSRSPN